MKFANPLKKSKTIASVRGHIIEFPGKTAEGLTFVHVPPVVVPEAIAAGLMPESEIEEVEESAVPQAPLDPEARKAAVFKAFEQLVAAGERDDFAGNSFPKAEAVTRVLGWKVDSKEIKVLWPEFQSTAKE
jgi:hypothetical protein